MRLIDNPINSENSKEFASYYQQKNYSLQNITPLVKVSYFKIKILGRGSRERYTLCAGESGGSLRNCKDMALFEQAFEHIKECNTWNKTTCPR